MYYMYGNLATMAKLGLLYNYTYSVGIVRNYK